MELKYAMINQTAAIKQREVKTWWCLLLDLNHIIHVANLITSVYLYRHFIFHFAINHANLFSTVIY